MKARFEKINEPGDNSYKYFSYEIDTFNVPFHYHPEYELTYIASSHGVRYIGNNVSGFSENDLVLIGPNVPHCGKNISKQEEKASAVVFHWKEDLLGEGWVRKKEFKDI